MDSKLASHIEQKGKLIQQLEAEIAKVVVGQRSMIRRLLIGLFTNGHVLLEGVPGLAKTLTVNTLAQALDLQFKWIQFTPDLLPADLIGTMIYNQKQGAFEVKKGPVFSHIVLADEINRSPAKVQSALLEAMQERQVTIGEETFPLDEPFLVLATQNPVDQEGTYPLPEAQVDRFMLKVFVDYPTKAEEKAIMKRMARTKTHHEVKPVLSKQDIFDIRALVDEVSLKEKLEDYIIDIVLATREPAEYGMKEVADYIEFGASPRATLALTLGAKAHALLEGRAHALPEDVKAIAPDVLNHRILLNYEAEAEEITTLQVIERLLKTVKF